MRLVNEIDSDHPMHHPFHVHGPGRWMAHCHIVEHNGNGMAFSLDVTVR